MRKHVAIIGAGPSGLLLGHLLRAAGVDVIVIERQSGDYVLSQIRAGVLETVTTDVMHRLGIDARMNEQGLIEGGFNLASTDRVIRIDIKALTGRHVMVYGQTELTRDLMDAAPDRDLQIVYEAGDVALHDLETDAPSVTYTKDGQNHRIEARFIAGCDGFHGASAKQFRRTAAREYERVYPFGWLGILADVPPCHPELIYANTERGFALASMRSTTRSRYYIQVPLTEKVEDWSEDRLWDELETRFNPLQQAWRYARRSAGNVDRAASLLCLRNDALWSPVPCRRCGPYRSADRSEGPEPCCFRRNLSV